jgi:hypothetical protein
LPTYSIILLELVNIEVSDRCRGGVQEYDETFVARCELSIGRPGIGKGSVPGEKASSLSCDLANARPRWDVGRRGRVRGSQPLWDSVPKRFRLLEEIDHAFLAL